MTRTTDTENTEITSHTEKAEATEDRWYEAARRADPVMLPNLRTGRLWPTLVTCVMLIAATVLGYGLLFGNDLTGRPASDLLETLIPLVGLGLQRSAVLLGIVGLLVGALVTHVRTHWQPIAGALTREERRSIRLQMAGEDVVDFRRLPLIVVIAKQQHQYTRSLVPVYGAALLFTISWALLSDSVEVHYLSLGIAVVLIVIGAWMLVTFRRVDAFIATHSHRVYERTEAWNTLVDELRESELNPGRALVQDDAADEQTAR
jgi:hypothetical protein